MFVVMFIRLGEPSALRREKSGGRKSARLCRLLLVHVGSQSLGLFIQDTVHTGQILQLAYAHAFNPSLRSFLSPSDDRRDFLLSCWSVWSDAVT